MIFDEGSPNLLGLDSIHFESSQARPPQEWPPRSPIRRAQALGTDNRQKSLLNTLSDHWPNSDNLVDFPGPNLHFFNGKTSNFIRCVSCYIYLRFGFAISIIDRCLQKQGDQFESLRPLQFYINPG